MEENYTLICNFAKSIFAEWEGKIVEEPHGISLIANNDLCGKKVECKCTIGLLHNEKYPFCVDGMEKTCSIIGGCGYPCENLEEAKKDAMAVLFRYKFKHKEQEQLSLFDFE